MKLSEGRSSKNCALIKGQKTPNIGHFAREFNIPVYRLRNRSNGRTSLSTRSLRNKALLSKAKERAFI